MKLFRYQTSPIYTPSVSYPSLRDEMDRLFDVAFPALSSLHNGFFGDDALSQFPVDFYQDKDAFYTRAELPGFRKEDISVEVTDGYLTISAHEKSDEKSGEKDGGTTTRERRVSRALTLPDNLQVEKIHAAYENGVLTVTLPKAEEIKPKQIAIEVK